MKSAALGLLLLGVALASITAPDMSKGSIKTQLGPWESSSGLPVSICYLTNPPTCTP